MKFLQALLSLFVLPFVNVYAQPSLEKMKSKIDTEKTLSEGGITMNLTSKTQGGVLFSNTTVIQADASRWLSQNLALRKGVDNLQQTGKAVQASGMQVVKYQQYYKGLKVEHGIVNVASRNNKLALAQLEFYPLADDFSTVPVLSEQQALEKAMAFTKGKVFVWERYKGTKPDYLKPKGELVIMQTYQKDESLCLAYKFRMHSLVLLDISWVYVDALTGKVVLKDDILKNHHYGEEKSKPANSNASVEKNERPTFRPSRVSDYVDGTAATRYSGTKSFVTQYTPGAGAGPKPYSLVEERNGHIIYTMNFERRASNGDSINENNVVHFEDNDNNWTAAEFNNANMDNAALDAHYSMEWVSDYWIDEHERNGWDNENSLVVNYVHVAENEYDDGNLVGYERWMNNAFWNGSNMYYGDGDGPGGTTQPLTALDVCAHEMGHAITQTTSALVYRWESGALNEGFSDIWAACVTDYARNNDGSLTTESIWRVGERVRNVQTATPGLRDMQNPLLFDDPSTYKSTNWRPASYEDCKVQDGDNDHCGVHTNSGVLNKWFHLVTAGEQGINTKNQPYNIFGIGFGRSSELAYMMELTLTPNSGYTTARAVSLNIAATLFGAASSSYLAVKDAWAAVGLDSSVFVMGNTPVFTTNSFRSIGVGKDGVILSGTTYAGMYKYSNNQWAKLTELTDVSINDIKPDKEGNLWVAQSGRVGQVGGGGSIGGGVSFFRAPFSNLSQLYTNGDNPQVPSRNARCIYVDTFRMNQGIYHKVWMSGLAYFHAFNSISGGLGQGYYNEVQRPFKPVTEGINTAAGTVGCLTMGGIRDEIWTFAQSNFGINQLLTYNPETYALIRTYDHNSVSDIPTGFVARAIYGDRKNRVWVGTVAQGIMILDEDKIWHFMDSSDVVPIGTSVSFNAIAGNPYGDVYIGTNKGLLFFDHGIGQINRLDDPKNFKMYTKEHGLPSNAINAIAYDTTRMKLLIATDSGIIFWDPPCLGESCDIVRNTLNGESETKGNGNWSNPAIWSTGLVPDSTTNVVIRDTIAIDIKAKCRAIAVERSGAITVNAGQGLKIFMPKRPIQENSQQATGRRRRR